MESENPDTKPERETGKTEKQGGESQPGPAALLPVEEPPNSEAEVQEANKGGDETDREEAKAFNKLADAEQEQTRWERMQGEWTRYGAVMTAVLSLLTLLVLIQQNCTLSKQLESMQSSSNDTQKMIVAMQQQANASQNTADRQRDIVEQMGRQANASIDAAAATTKQAAASQTQANASVAQAGIAKQALGAAQSSARATEQSVQISREALRPIVGVNVEIRAVEETKIEYAIVIRNEGGTSAEVVLRQCPLNVIAPSPLPTVAMCNPVTTSGSLRVLPHRDIPNVVRVTSGVEFVRQRKSYLMAVGEITYFDYTGVRVVPFCYVYREEFKGMGDCSDLANAENQNKPD